MKIFLTGEIQVGKSTVITKTLSLLKVTPGGFKTYYGPDRGSPDRFLYLNSAAEPQVYSKEKAVVRFTQGNPPEVLTEKFDTLGAELIRTARINSKLILMDECGSLEREAFFFQKEILDTLDSDLPVLGVIKLISRGWTDRIRNHSEVTLLTVTAENRDNLPLMIAPMFRL